MKVLQRLRAAGLVAIFALLPVCGCGAQGKANAPAEVRDLLLTAESAVNGKDFEALRARTDGDAAQIFGWVKDSLKSDWQTDYLLPPGSGNAGQAFVVFHVWHTCESDGDHVHRLIRAADGWKIGAEVPETETNGYRVRDHDLQVTFNISQKTATIHDTALLERTAAPKFPAALMRLSEDFILSRFTDKNDAPIAFAQVGNIVAFTPPKAQKFALKLDYSGKVDHAGSDYIRDNEATLNSYWYPTIARLPAAATVTVTAPPGWTPIGQGEQTAEKTETDGSLTRAFRNPIPTCFFTVDIGKYFITTRKSGRLTLAAYLLHQDDALARNSLDTLQKSMALFESRFSRYPYTKYTLVETLGPFPGALEAYSFATFGSGSMRDSIAHELSHTWWGGVVPCAYIHSMWNEGFADYSEGLLRRAETKAADSVTNPAPRRATGKIYESYPLIAAHDSEDNAQTAVGYGKGAMVARALEAEIGQTLMQRCLSAFIADHPRGELAEWPDFEAVVNKTTGKNYRWFFAQWTERTGLPSAHLGNPAVKRDGADYLIEADFAQTREPIYRLSVPLTLETGGKPVTALLLSEGKMTHIILRTKSVPKRLLADPEGTLPLAASVTVIGQNPLELKF